MNTNKTKQAERSTPHPDRQVRAGEAMYRGGLIAMLERQLAEAREQRDRLVEALEKAESLAIAWVGYWKHSPIYGNGTSHPKHIDALVRIKSALAAVKENQPRS